MSTRPTVTYPPQLPVSQRKDEILAAIRDHQVVVVAGETGSGKTTQLPKICLELGRGESGMIGHTQPRRLAARTVAERIAQELGGEVGGAVGYQVRFTDRVSRDTRVKVMTDGILLAEIQRDRMLRRYDTLIIDEAHERSLNVDFILGYLKQLLPRRPDLKVVITSATIDPHRFAAHFDAPVIEVSGRTYPVEIRYRPYGAQAQTPNDLDQTEAICEAVTELRAGGSGDILVFASGEREIRDAAEALGRMDLRDTEILPLYARLSAAEQHRVFQPHRGRRVVLATNVAETSLTVPGIRYVIDPGTARISRYSHRTKVQRLPIEPISQASANQRAGRCGRVADGICLRLYPEEDFAARPEFTEPEILRTNLASVILQMTALGLGDIAAFPFLDPPDHRNVKAGIELLQEIGALDAGRLTKVGRQLAQVPIDPRLARMLLAAQDGGCVREVLVITAGLAIQDPRERPAEAAAAADEKHGRFAEPGSDFLAYLNLWEYLREQQRAGSGSQFRRLCKAEFLNYLRVREWQDLESQLRQIVKSLGLTLNSTPAAPDSVHTALLAGLLSHVGLKDGEKREYFGARGTRFALFPGSALAKKPPRWVMAAELVETSRLWARIAADVEPAWVERVAGHLVKRQYSEPHWEARRAGVVASEKVTLYGVPLVAARKVDYGRIDPALSRELFIRHALVEGDWHTSHAFFAENRALLAEVAELEHRARRRDILVDDETLFDFYDRRVPADVVSARHFDRWWKQARGTDPDLLSFERSMLVNQQAPGVDAVDYPDVWPGTPFRLSYQFEPGTDADGVTVHIPLPVLSRVSPAAFEWQIPGLRTDLATALIRSLPKAVRRNLVPAPDFAHDAVVALAPPAGRAEPFLPALERELGRLSGTPVPPDAWDLAKVPDHLKVTFRVLDEHGATLAEDKDLVALQARLRPQAREVLAAAATGLERRGLRDFDLDALPRTVTHERGGLRVTDFPALVDDGDSVAVRLLDSAAEQAHAMWRGTRRLLALTVPSPVPYVSQRLSTTAKLTLLRYPHGSLPELLDDCVTCALDLLIERSGGPAWDRAGFAALRETVRAGLAATVLGIVGSVQRVLAAAHQVQRRVDDLGRDPALLPSLVDAREQLAGLVRAGFVTSTGAARLAELPRYLRALEYRLDKLPGNPARDRQQVTRIAEVTRQYRELHDQLTPGHPATGPLEDIRWMIEELRVNLFAQALGTPYPVSDKRVYKALDALG
ncbi:MAG: ATP-dependent helicase HrpA [Micromonosporaceae bacterium]